MRPSAWRMKSSGSPLATVCVLVLLGCSSRRIDDTAGSALGDGGTSGAGGSAGGTAHGANGGANGVDPRRTRVSSVDASVESPTESSAPAAGGTDAGVEGTGAQSMGATTAGGAGGADAGTDDACEAY